MFVVFFSLSLRYHLAGTEDQQIVRAFLIACLQMQVGYKCIVIVLT